MNNVTPPAGVFALPIAFRTFWSIAACALALVAPPAAAFRSGVDVSSLPVLEAAGTTYSSGAVVGDPIQILRNQGVDWFRLRLFVDPSNDPDPFVVNDLAYTIALAQRVQATGGKLLLDLHYSDTWADPGMQFKPAAWEPLSFRGLRQQVYDYTRGTIESFANAGVLPAQVQVGNEIGNGMLWSDGYPWSGGNHDAGFDRLAQLLKAGIDGVRDGSGDQAPPEVLIHHAKGADGGATSYFFDKLEDRGLDYDAIGYSYYPRFHYDAASGDGNVADLAENIVNTANAYQKPVYVVEAGFAYSGQQFEPTYEFPVSVSGQAQFVDAVVDAVESVPGGLGGGVFWWYGEATPTPGLPVWEGGRYGLFDAAGELLPAAEALGAASVATTPGDFNGDGRVDAADYTTWRDDLEASFSASDQTVWAANYASTVIIPTTAVPEPTAQIAFLIASAAAFCPARGSRTTA